MDTQKVLRKFVYAGAELGESPVWDAHTQTLFFIDIIGGKIHAFDQEGLRTLYSSCSRIGALALTQAGNLIFTENDRVAIFDRQTLCVTQRSSPVSTHSGYRFNDGACDPSGRFITGLMDENHSEASGKLFGFDHQLNAILVYEPIGLPNGLAWNNQGDRLFFVDSVARKILRADYSMATGVLGNIALFAETPLDLGRPDGIAMDCEGGLWVCQFNGGCLLRYNAYGTLTDCLPVPVTRPTSCCFGGPGMKTLFITTARFGMSDEELKRYPDSGDLFSVDLPVSGTALHRFKAC